MTRREELFPHPVETAFAPDFKNPIDWKPICRAWISSFTWRVLPTAKFLTMTMPNSTRSIGLPRKG